MEKLSNSTSLLRTKSDQLVETMAAAMAAMKSPMSSGGSGEATQEGGGTHSRKSSRGGIPPSPGGGRNNNNNNTHIRKARSAQLKFDIDDVSSGAALSRASSASLGFSFSFTGFTVPPDEIADSKSFSDEDTTEDLEAGTNKQRLPAEPTLPLYLKVPIRRCTLKTKHNIVKSSSSFD
ncbi:ATP-binding cassette [Lithospermum erythrorhizon]|uniref:ATP-binding cassette n=1 Tax=Lithospermum erythrorhizon TaxID=34254 RepID=A0AAV3PW48_LITER